MVSQRAPAIHVINADGSNEIVLGSPETDFELRPSWNPDGERIAFTACLDPEDGDCAGPGSDNFELFVSNADGSNLQQITSTTEMELLIGWRP